MNLLTNPCFALMLVATTVNATSDSELTDQQLKPGWNGIELAAFTTGCVVAILTPAKASYAARAVERGNPDPKPFPEKEVVASLEPMCKCLSVRVAETWSLVEIQGLGASGYQPLVEEAMRGGRCKPTGLLGRMMERTRS